MNTLITDYNDAIKTMNTPVNDTFITIDYVIVEKASDKVWKLKKDIKKKEDEINKRREIINTSNKSDTTIALINKLNEKVDKKIDIKTNKLDSKEEYYMKEKMKKKEKTERSIDIIKEKQEKEIDMIREKAEKEISLLIHKYDTLSTKLQFDCESYLDYCDNQIKQIKDNIKNDMELLELRKKDIITYDEDNDKQLIKYKCELTTLKEDLDKAEKSLERANIDFQHTMELKAKERKQQAEIEFKLQEIEQKPRDRDEYNKIQSRIHAEEDRIREKNLEDNDRIAKQCGGDIPIDVKNGFLTPEQYILKKKRDDRKMLRDDFNKNIKPELTIEQIQTIKDMPNEYSNLLYDLCFTKEKAVNYINEAKNNMDKVKTMINNPFSFKNANELEQYEDLDISEQVEIADIKEKTKRSALIKRYSNKR